MGAGKECSDKLVDEVPLELNDYCCATCSLPARDVTWQRCPSTGSSDAQTCTVRAACDSGYRQFIEAIGDLVSRLPFTAEELYCLVETELVDFAGSRTFDWQAVADVFATDGGSTCIASVGPYASAVQRLISKLPAALPSSAWGNIGSLLGKACGAIQNHEQVLNTLLKLLPDNEADYNRMMTAVADIIEKFIDDNANAVDANQVIEYLI